MSLESLFKVPLQPVDISTIESRLDSVSLQELSEVKGKLESNLDALFDHLNSQKMDMESSLLTTDGYPRSDIDVVQVRLARSKIHVYRNDLRKVLNWISIKMEASFAGSSSNNTIGTENELQNLQLGSERKNQPQTAVREQVQSQLPFILITDVIHDSPGYKAGLKRNDKIVQFGEIDATNNGSNLLKISQLLQANRDREIRLKIKNDTSEIVEKVLMPSDDWAGQGLLGCKLNLI